MATKEQLQQQLSRCNVEIHRAATKLHTLRLLESQLQAAIKRTPV